MKMIAHALGLLSALFFFTSPGIAAGEDNAYEVVKVEEIQMSKDDIYKNSLQWIGETFRSAKTVIDLQDKESGVVIGNGIIGFNTPGLFSPDPHKAMVKIKVEAKDQKYRITLNRIMLPSIKIIGTQVIETGEWEQAEKFRKNTFEKPIMEELNKLADNLKTYLSNSAKRGDF